MDKSIIIIQRQLPIATLRECEVFNGIGFGTSKNKKKYPQGLHFKG